MSCNCVISPICGIHCASSPSCIAHTSCDLNRAFTTIYEALGISPGQIHQCRACSTSPGVLPLLAQENNTSPKAWHHAKSKSDPPIRVKGTTRTLKLVEFLNSDKPADAPPSSRLDAILNRVGDESQNISPWPSTPVPEVYHGLDARYKSLQDLFERMLAAFLSPPMGDDDAGSPDPFRPLDTLQNWNWEQTRLNAIGSTSRPEGTIISPIKSKTRGLGTSSPQFSPRNGLRSSSRRPDDAYPSAASQLSPSRGIKRLWCFSDSEDEEEHEIQKAKVRKASVSTISTVMSSIVEIIDEASMEKWKRYYATMERLRNRLRTKRPHSCAF